MFRPILSLVALAAVLLAGCATPSLHPIYSPEREIQEPALEGAWQPADGGDKATYTLARQGAAYTLTIRNNDPKEPQIYLLEAHLARLGKHTFVDLTPPEKSRDENGEKWGEFFLPTHMFVRYEIKGDTLTVWHLDRDWLKKSLEAGSPAVACAKAEGDTILITAPTPQLQAFLEKFGADPEAFKPSSMKRVKP